MALKSILIKLGIIDGKKTQKGLDNVDKSIKNIGKSAIKAGAAFFGGRALISGLQRSVELSAKFEGIERGFNNLARSAGFSAQAFEKFKKATDGTIGSTELMTQANNAMLLGITDSEDQMAEMFDIAQRLAQALGKDAAFGIESLVTGLGRQSKLMLDNLGIMIDVEKANESYAKSLDKTASELTDQERKQAFVNEAMRSAKGLVSDLGEEQLTTADRIARMNASMEEMALAIGEIVVPIFEKLEPHLKLALDFWGDYLQTTGDVGEETNNMSPLMEALNKEIESQASLVEYQLSPAYKMLGDTRAKFNEVDIFEQMSIDGEMLENNKELLALLRKEYEAELKAQEKAAQLRKENAESQDALKESLKPPDPTEWDLFIEKQKKLAETQQLELDYTDALIENYPMLAQQLGLVVSEEEKQKKIKEDKQKLIIDELKQAALVQGSAMDAMKAVVRAESMEAAAGYIASIFKSVPFPLNLVAAAGAGAIVSGIIDKGLSSFAKGGDFVTDGPQMMMVGDNPGGRERVQVSPLSSPNINGPQGGVTVNVSGGIVQEDYIRNELIPALNKANSMGS